DPPRARAAGASGRGGAGGNGPDGRLLRNGLALSPGPVGRLALHRAPSERGGRHGGGAGGRQGRHRHCVRFRPAAEGLMSESAAGAAVVVPDRRPDAVETARRREVRGRWLMLAPVLVVLFFGA